MPSLKLTPKQQWKNPVMFVVYLGSILTTVLWLQALGGRRRRAGRLYSPCFTLVVVYRTVRQLCRSGGGRAQQGAGRIFAQRQARYHRQKAG